MYWFEVKINGERRGVVAAISAQIAKEKMNAKQDDPTVTATRITATEANAMQANMKEEREMATFMEMIEKANSAKTTTGKLNNFEALLTKAEAKGDATKAKLIQERIDALKAEKVKAVAKRAKKETQDDTEATPAPKAKKAAKPRKKVLVDMAGADSEFEYLVRREFTVVNGKTKWEFKDGVPEGRFPVPPVEKDTINNKQNETFKALRGLFVKADKAVKANTTIEKFEEAGVLVMVYETTNKAGQHIKRVAAIYGGGRPAVWGQRPNGERRLMWGANDAVQFGAYIDGAE